jgi:hypothetical protein
MKIYRIAQDIDKIYSKQEMISMGADGWLPDAVLVSIPIDKISGREPVPRTYVDDSGIEQEFKSGKEIKVPIEVDHIVPVSKGGKNDELNLITSCFDCNRGKSNNELDIVLDTTISKVEKIKIAQEQYREIKKLLNKEKKIINEQIDEIESLYSSVYEDYCFATKFRISVKKFILNKWKNLIRKYLYKNDKFY